MVIRMEIINKVEGLIFKQVLHYPLIQVVENKTVIINDRCTVEHFSEEFCKIKTPHICYELTGVNLRVKEYGDFVIRIESDGVKKIEIVGDQNEK